MENCTTKKCRVKYLEVRGKRGQFETVCSSRIKNHLFNNCAFKKSMKYKLTDEDDESKITKVQMICVAESQEEMDIKLASLRIPSTPARLLESDQPSDDSDSQVKSQESTSKSTKTRSFKSVSDNDSAEDVSRNTKLRRCDTKCTSDGENESSKNDSSFVNQLSPTRTVEKDVETVIIHVPEKSNEKEELLEAAKNSINEKESSRPKIANVENLIHNDVLKLKDRQIADLKRENKSLEKKYKNLKDDYASLNTKYDELQTGHLKLVNNVTQDIKDIKVLIDQKNKIENSTGKSINPQWNEYPVGYFVEGKGVHLGFGEYMTKDIHDSLLADSTTPSMFVGNILLSIFGKNVLLVSTLTGRQTNRQGKKEKKNQLPDDCDSIDTDQDPENDNGDNEDTNNKENKTKKLDHTKVNACKAYYIHWLEYYYELELTKTQKKTYDRSQEIANFKEYATKKISNLKQTKASKSKKKSKLIPDDPLAFTFVSPSNLSESQNSFHLDPIVIDYQNRDLDNEDIYDESLLESSSEESE